MTDQQVSVDRSQSRGRIIAGVGVKARNSRDTVVAAGDVVEDLSPAIRKLSRRQSVENGIDVPLRRAVFLHDQGHRSCQRWSRRRRAGNGLQQSVNQNYIRV